MALRLQDLPAEHVIAFMGMPPGYKERMGVRLFALASGQEESGMVEGLTFGELETMITDWLVASAETEEPDGPGVELDWSELLR